MRYIRQLTASVLVGAVLASATLFASGTEHAKAGSTDADASGTLAALAPPFDVGAARSAKGKRATKRFACEKPPRPVATLSLRSKYAQTEGRAEIDPERLRAYTSAMAPIEQFKSRLVALSNRYVSANPADPAIARCAVTWLATWARHGALDQPGGEGDEAARAALLTAASLAYLQIRDDPGLRGEDKQVIASWIGRLANRVVDDYGDNPERASRRNNLRYWAGWSAMTASFVVNDRRLFGWALESARVGIAQIADDGTLPLELQRKQRALGYHVYALQALVLVAEGAAANGVDLYGERDGAILRLARRSFNAMRDPADFKRLTGFKQELKDTMSGSKLAFVALLAGRLPSVDLPYWKKRVGPLRSTAIGGDVDLLYRTAASGPPT